MSMGKAMHQMSAQAGRITVGDGETVSGVLSDEARPTRHDTVSAGQGLLTQVLARENMQRAWKRVKANKGAAGMDGMDIAQTGRYLVTALPTIREQVMAGTYRPSPVRRVGIPKLDGSERELGIPTVVDRLIQQAVLQVLQPLIDPTFSQHSHGFRPGRRARDAVLEAQQYVIWRELDEWMRHRLRAIQLKHWKRGTTAYRECIALGAKPWLAQKVAANCRRWWFISSLSLNGVLKTAYFDRLGFPRLS